MKSALVTIALLVHDTINMINKEINQEVKYVLQNTVQLIQRSRPVFFLRKQLGSHGEMSQRNP
jgi:hypothetical protein